MTLAPISTSGGLQTTAVSRRSPDGTTSHSLQQTASVGTRSYIWHPWFATVEGKLDLTYDKSYGQESNSAVRASGGGTLSVLPQSRYPVSLTLEHTDSRASGASTASDVIRDRVDLTAGVGFSQSFNGRVRANWDRTDRDGSGVRSAQGLGLGLSKSFSQGDFILGINNIGFEADLRRSTFSAEDPEDEDRSALTGTLRLNINSKPFKDVSYSSRYTAIYDELDEDAESLKRTSLQGLSTMQWRPEGKPFVVTGSLRTLTERLAHDDGGSAADTETLLAASNVGLRWPLNDRLSVGLGLRGLVQSVDRGSGGAIGESGDEAGTTINAGFIANANYNSERRKVADFDWSWTARVQTDNGFDNTDGLSTRNSVTLGHRFERFFDDLFFIPVSLAFAQDATTGFDEGREVAVTASISDSVSLAYSGSRAGSSTTARLSLRDTRNLIGSTRELQMLQARVGRRVAIDRDRRLSGNLSAQAVRQVSDDGSDISVSATGVGSFTQRDLFNVDNLSFRSELRVHLIDLEKLLGESEEDTSDEFLRNDWRNTLTYQIGRLTTGLEVSAFQREAGIGYLGIVRVSRAFGG